MSKIYIYHPFAGYKQDAVMAGDKDHFKETGLDVEVIDPVGDGPLSIVGDDDLLLIHAHGDVDTPMNLYLCTPTGDSTITANALADQLESHGLKKTHQSILQISCWGGGDSGLKSGVTPEASGKVSAGDISVTKNKYGQCFASVLAKALGQRSYRSVLVGGFPGIFSAVSYTLGKKTAFISGGVRVQAQLDHIQWFDCRGVNTSDSKAAVGRVRD